MKTICNDNTLTVTKAGFKHVYKTKKEYTLAKLNALMEIKDIFFPYSRYKEFYKA